MVVETQLAGEHVCRDAGQVTAGHVRVRTQGGEGAGHLDPELGEDQRVGGVLAEFLLESVAGADRNAARGVRVRSLWGLDAWPGSRVRRTSSDADPHGEGKARLATFAWWILLADGLADTCVLFSACRAER